MPPLVRVALVQFRPRKGPHTENLARLGDLFAQLDALEPRPHVAALAETALTGYLVEGGVREVAVDADTLARDLNDCYRANAAAGTTFDVTLGFYELAESTIYNSAMYVTLGGAEPLLRHVHRKMFLPTYGLFDEARFVNPGLEVRAFDTSWGRAAMLVCEDAWHSVMPAIAALDGAQVIFVPSASPGRGVWPSDGGDAPAPASLARWERLARDIADEHAIFTAFVLLVGNEGGKAFVGSSLIAGPKGELRARAPLWDEAIVTAELDLADITRARADSTMLADLRTMLPHVQRALERVSRAGSTSDSDDANAAGS